MVRIQRYREGTRITVTRAALPLDSGLLGRSGTVVYRDRWTPTRYAVRLDGERDVRIFEEAELLEQEADNPAAEGAPEGSPS